MAKKKKTGKQTVELRYYDFPENELVLCLQGEDWVRAYWSETRVLHFHNLMEIGLCRWGEGHMVFDQGEIPYEAGAVTLIPANCLHTTVSRNGEVNAWEWLFVDPERILRSAFPDDPLFADAVLRRLQDNANLLPGSDPQAGQLADLMTLVMQEAQENREYRRDVLSQLLTALLLVAARLNEEKGTPVRPLSAEFRQILPALEYVDHHYMHPISVSDLAERCSLSEAHLRRKYLEYLNMTPGEQLSLVRIRKSCELLNTTALSVSEISQRVGYQSASSFGRAFQKLLGTTPYQYKIKGADKRGQPIRPRISAKPGWL